MLIIVSDLHLGSDGSDWLQFEKFLDNIRENKENNSGKLKDVNTIILLGDVFDLLRDNLNKISQEYKDKIFKKLEYFHLRSDFHVFFGLGNHDLYLQKYDREGERTETELIDPIGFEFYEEQFYVALLRNVNGQWQLEMYDEQPTGFFGRFKRLIYRIFHIKRNYEKLKTVKFDETANLGPSIASQDFLCLLCHGHQYETMEELTEQLDLLLSKIPGFTKKGSQEAMDFMEKPIVNTRRFMMKHKHNWIPLERKKIHQAYNNSPFYKQIGNITDVIYGHTHIVDPPPSESVVATEEGLRIVNTGCWLMTTPSYVLIHDDGKITTHFFEG